MSSTENDPQELADAREREADELAHRSEQLQSDVQDTRADWERKRADDSVPGAPPREGSEAGDSHTDDGDDDGHDGE